MTLAVITMPSVVAASTTVANILIQMHEQTPLYKCMSQHVTTDCILTNHALQVSPTCDTPTH